MCKERGEYMTPMNLILGIGMAECLNKFFKIVISYLNISCVDQSMKFSMILKQRSCISNNFIIIHKPLIVKQFPLGD